MKETQMAGSKITLLDLAVDINESAGQALSKLGEMVGRRFFEEEKETIEPGNRVDDMEGLLFSIRAQIWEINSCLDRLSQRFGSFDRGK